MSGSETRVVRLLHSSVFVTGGEDGRLRFYQGGSSDKLLYHVKRHDSVILGISFCSKESILFSCGARGELVAWHYDGVSGKCVWMGQAEPFW